MHEDSGMCCLICAREIDSPVAKLFENFQVLSQPSGVSECTLLERVREREAELLKRAAGRTTAD